MDSNQVNFWITVNADKFSPEVLPVVKTTLEQMDNNQMMYLQNISIKKPSTIFLIAFLLGWERFLLGDIGLGIVKVVTGYGCGIWWLIDVISAKKRAMKYNFKQFQKATSMMGGDFSSAPVSNGEVFSTTEFPQPQLKTASFFEKVKNIITSPSTAWEAINEDNSLPISYLCTLAAIPAVALFLGFFVRGIYYAIKISYGAGEIFGRMLLCGFATAITAYAIIMILGFLSALVPFLFAGKFSSEKSYNKAFALISSAMTPLCLLGILLVYPIGFPFWLWIIAGAIYGRYLICNGTQILLKTPLEKHTLYVGICADVFLALTILLNLILFTELDAFNFTNGYSFF